MKTKINPLLTLIALAAFFIACDRPDCKNTNPLFDRYSPDSREYKAELLRQLEIVDKAKLTYWFNQYIESDGQEQLFFNVQGDGLCAIIVINVKEWGKLKELRQKQGAGFRGAEFRNLQFDIKKTL